MPAKKPLKSVPHFQNEDEERAFWATADSTDYVDWNQAQRLRLAKLNPSAMISESTRN